MNGISVCASWLFDEEGTANLLELELESNFPEMMFLSKSPVCLASQFGDVIYPKRSLEPAS